MFEPNSKKKTGGEGGGPTIQPYPLKDIRSPGPLVYATPTLQNSLRAASEIPQRDRKFSIDPLLKDILTNDDETEKQIRNQVEERIRKLRDETLEKARAEGEAQGLEQGRRLAEEQYGEEARAKLDQLEKAIAKFEGLEKEFGLQHEKFACDLIVRIGKTILRDEVKTDPGYIQRVIRAVIEQMGAREVLKIQVSRDLIELVQEIRPELLAKFPTLKNYTIDVNPDFTELECVIETDWNKMNASFDMEIERIRGAVVARVDQAITESRNSGEIV